MTLVADKDNIIGYRYLDIGIKANTALDIVMELLNVHMFFLNVMYLIAASRVTADPVEFCQWETFSADCGEDKVIVVESAIYGRMEPGRCIERDYGYVGCAIDVTLMSDIRCSGMHSCQIEIPDKRFDRVTPCPKDLRRYLVIEYRCQPVINPPKNCIGDGSMELTSPSGLIASVTTDETGCGSTSAPWIIKGRPGQTVILTMTDFAVKDALLNDTAIGERALNFMENHCHVYAIIKERAIRTKDVARQTICGGKSRGGNTKAFKSNELEVRVMTGQTGRKRHFLLEYNIVGCADLQAPSGGWLERHDHMINAGCTVGRIEWTLECVDNRWKGILGNCTSANTQMLSRGYSSFTQTLSIVVILAVALGIGALILCVGLVCIRRRRRMAEVPDESYVTTGPRPLGNKDSIYRTANATYNGYTPATSAPRNDASDENDYEYVDDIKPVAPSGEPKSMNRTTAKDKCVMHRENNQYTKYGTNINMEAGKALHSNAPRHNPHVGNISHHVPPQYFELDPDEQGAGKGNVYHGNVGVTAHGGSQTDDMDFDRKPNLSFGHYSQ